MLLAERLSIRSSVPDSGIIYLLQTIENDSETSPIHLLNGHPCLFAWGYSDRDVKLVIHLHLVPPWHAQA